LQFDSTHDVHALFAAIGDMDELPAHANFVAVALLPLLELHAAENEATEARANPARLRNPIMKEPPE
jgi:hypothetical protein